MIHFLLGGAGSGKSTRLIAGLAQAAQTGARTYALVPEQFSFTFDSKLYTALGVQHYNALESMTFTSLSRMLFRTYGGRSGEYADELTRTLLLHETIAELAQKKALPYYARQVNGQAFSAAVGKVLTELRRAGVSPAVFAEKTTALEERLREKSEDLAVIYAAYDAALTERGLKDSLTDISEAAALAAGTDFFAGAQVFIDEFESFTGDQLAFVEVLLAQAAEVYIALRTAEPEAPAFSVFDTPNATLRQLRRLAAELHLPTETVLCTDGKRFRHDDLAQVSVSLTQPNRTWGGDAPHLHLIEARNCYNEVDYVCAEICRLVREEDVRYREIALVTHQLPEYSGMLEAACRRCGIPCHIDGSRGVMHTAVMQLVSAVLELISTARPDTEAVLRYCKTQLLGVRCERIARLEQYCYTWSVDGDLWLQPFPVTEAEADIETLRAFLIDPLVRLRKTCRKAGCAAICHALYQFLVEMQVLRNISGVARAYRDAGDTYSADALRQLWGALMDVMDTLAGTLGDREISISHFRNLCQALFATIPYTTPPQLLDCVVVSPAETARLNEPRFVFVLGVNEGCFPHNVSVNGLFTDRDKLVLADAGLSVSRPVECLLADERLIVYKTLSAASEGLYLSYPLADEGGSARMPSAVIAGLCVCFPEIRRIYAERLSPVFYAVTPQAAYHRYAEEDDADSPARASVRAALQTDPVFGARLAALTTRAALPAHRISDPALVRQVFSDSLRLSPTGVEQYMECPFAYYMTQGLKLCPPEKKELNALEAGNLVHYCLEQLLAECGSKAAFVGLSASELQAKTAAAAMRFQTEEMGGAFGKTARFAGNYARLSAGIPPVLAHLQAELRQSAFAPAALELRLSDRDGDKPIRLTASNGIELVFSGKIDRVDVYTEDGVQYVRVIDYKTGAKSFDLGHLLYGLDMQMLLYLFTLIGPDGRFAGAKPAGVLYMPAGAPACGLERDGGTVEQYLNQTYCMNGVLLRQKSVLVAMEEALAGVYIPAVLAPDDGSGELLLQKESPGGFLTEDGFARVQQYMNDMLDGMATRLYAGEIPALPLEQGGKLPCRYCALSAVCGNGNGAVCRSYDKAQAQALIATLTKGAE